MLFEAPNWTPDGDWLIVNGDGLLQRVPAAGGELEAIVVPGLPLLNNDHVLSPDGSSAYVSGFDGHLHHVDLAARTSRRVSNDRGPAFIHFLHGVSPDGPLLAYIGMDLLADGGVRTNIFTVPTAGGPDVQLTDSPRPARRLRVQPGRRSGSTSTPSVAPTCRATHSCSGCDRTAPASSNSPTTSA